MLIVSFWEGEPLALVWQLDIATFVERALDCSSVQVCSTSPEVVVRRLKEAGSGATCVDVSGSPSTFVLRP